VKWSQLVDHSVKELMQFKLKPKPSFEECFEEPSHPLGLRLSGLAQFLFANIGRSIFQD
jgi:hypothetical protein